jgi:poly-gamma-glutamate capsule biosynthesis protein CapA/YwtB (metallophosphatase superfamily)
VSGDLVVFLAGDSLIQHRVSPCQDERFLDLVRLIRDADVAIANLECCIQTGEDWPAFAAGGGRAATYMATPPFCIDELQQLGFRMVFTANNHSQDFGEGGIVTTLRHLDAAGMRHAGTGPSMTAANAATYFDTPNGRVALIAAADWGPRGLADLPYPWPVGALAADADQVFPARPGVNLLRYDAVTHVDERGLAALRELSDRLGWDEVKLMRNQGGGRSEPMVGNAVFEAEVDGEDWLYFMGRKFVLDDHFTFETVPYEEDIERNCRWIREARANADCVIVGQHQQGATRSADEPPDHTRIFAHAAIDAGADIFGAHGHGRAGGIEVYKGRVAIYGLPGLINQISQVRAVPLEQKIRLGLGYQDTPSEFMRTRTRREATAGTEIESRRDSFMPLVFHTLVLGGDGHVEEVRLHPAEAIAGGLISHEGLPRLVPAGSEVARRTLEVMSARMAPFGTELAVEDGIGVIRPSAQKPVPAAV